MTTQKPTLRRFIEVERADWMTHPGKIVTLTLGPFGFTLNTADGVCFGWDIRFRGGGFGWTVWRGVR